MVCGTGGGSPGSHTIAAVPVTTTAGGAVAVGEVVAVRALTQLCLYAGQLGREVLHALSCAAPR